LIAHELTHVLQQRGEPRHVTGGDAPDRKPRITNRTGTGVQRQEEQTEERLPERGERVVPTGRRALGPMPMIDPHTGEVNLYPWIAAWLAANKYDNPLHKELVYHYVYAEGATFELTQDKMMQVTASGSRRVNFFHPTRFPAVTAAMKTLEVNLLAQGGASRMVSEEFGATASISTHGVGYCDSDKPSLGGFTIILNGTLEARMLANSDTVNYEFTGTMRWIDYWDFDPMRPAKPGEEEQSRPKWRSEDAEEGVRKANKFLPGLAFHIESPDVPVTQRDGDEGARW